jgi:hypothetical protein
MSEGYEANEELPEAKVLFAFGAFDRNHFLLFATF